MNLMSGIRLLGGLALFIFGMVTMGGGLERVAGEKLEKTLEKVTGNLFKGLLMGALVTAVIQSSSATTVMVVGFVNAGIMTLRQSVGVILGANIGTTITAQILRMDSTGALGESFLMQIIKPANLAYVVVFVGIVLMLTAKKKKTKYIADILIGFGILFIGMSTMEGAVAPLRDVPAFQNLFVMFTNPLVGVLVGAVVTAVVQSSSASVGILQALSTTGMVSYAAAIPIILGQNIGTCVTAFISSIGANKNARRTAMVHLYFNLIGSVLFLLGVYLIKATLGFAFWDLPIDKGGIANFHTIFNLIATALFLPFTGFLVTLAEKTVPAKEEKADPFALLDPRFYQTPSLALDQCHKCVVQMSAAAAENFSLASQGIFDNTALNSELFKQNEHFLDRAEVAIGKYLLGLHGEITERSKGLHDEMLHSLSDFEKIGDYSQNVLETVEHMRENDIFLSEEAQRELYLMRQATASIIAQTADAYSRRDAKLADDIEPLEETIDTLKKVLKSSHIERLNDGACTLATGIPFLELVHNFEKIADHCSNIASYVLQLDKRSAFNVHDYAKKEQKSTENFKRLYSQYLKEYVEPLARQDTENVGQISEEKQ